MPSSARYGAWAGGFGILIAGVGVVLTCIGKAQAILMICLDVLTAVFFLVCGFVSTSLRVGGADVVRGGWGWGVS